MASNIDIYPDAVLFQHVANNTVYETTLTITVRTSFFFALSVFFLLMLTFISLVVRKEYCK